MVQETFFDNLEHNSYWVVKLGYCADSQKFLGKDGLEGRIQ